MSARLGAKGSPLLRFGSVTALVVADQLSKSAVFEWLDATPEGITPGKGKPILGAWLKFDSSCNPGAAFGQFTELPWVLVIGRALAVVFLSVLLLRADPRPRLVLVAMTLVLSGAFGNLIDNLWTGCLVEVSPFHGVRDFVAVYYEPLIGIDEYFPYFNLADSCITVGAVCWILASFLHKPAPAVVPEVPAGS